MKRWWYTVLLLAGVWIAGNPVFPASHIVAAMLLTWWAAWTWDMLEDRSRVRCALGLHRWTANGGDLLRCRHCPATSEGE